VKVHAKCLPDRSVEKLIGGAGPLTRCRAPWLGTWRTWGSGARGAGWPDMTCPKCDGDLDALAVMPWGRVKDSENVPAGWPIAPFICSWCASLLLIDCARIELYDVPAAGLAALRQNPVLSKMIDDARRLILAEPGRRPILR
jgi:hypothetical protein